LQLADISVRR